MRIVCRDEPDGPHHLWLGGARPEPVSGVRPLCLAQAGGVFQQPAKTRPWLPAHFLSQKKIIIRILKALALAAARRASAKRHVTTTIRRVFECSGRERAVVRRNLRGRQQSTWELSPSALVRYRRYCRGKTGRGRDGPSPVKAQAAPRPDPSERHYRTRLLPRVMASNRSSGQGC